MIDRANKSTEQLHVHKEHLRKQRRAFALAAELSLALDMPSKRLVAKNIPNSDSSEEASAPKKIFILLQERYSYYAINRSLFFLFQHGYIEPHKDDAFASEESVFARRGTSRETAYKRTPKGDLLLDRAIDIIDTSEIEDMQMGLHVEDRFYEMQVLQQLNTVIDTSLTNIQNSTLIQYGKEEAVKHPAIIQNTLLRLERAGLIEMYPDGGAQYRVTQKGKDFLKKVVEKLLALASQAGEDIQIGIGKIQF